MSFRSPQFRRTYGAVLAAAVGLVALIAAAAPTDAGPAGRPVAFSHVAVKATHYEESAAFYRDFLGFAEQGRLYYLDTGLTELVFLKINDAQWIEVFDAAHVQHRTGPIYQVAFRTRDAEALRQRVGQQGWPVPAKVGHGQMKNAGFTTRDPDGTVVEFVQYQPEGRTQRDRGEFLPATRISDHLIAVGLPTSRLPDALRLFRDALGLELQSAPPAATESGTAAVLRVPGSEDRLELNAAPGATPYFCLTVADVDAARVALEQRRERAHYRGPLNVVRDAAGRPTLTITDPEGIRVILVQEADNPAAVGAASAVRVGGVFSGSTLSTGQVAAGRLPSTVHFQR